MPAEGFGNNELQCYIDSREENAQVKDGLLVITAKLEEWTDGINSRNFTSAKITSKFDATYGKFEMRARLPKGKYMHIVSTYKHHAMRFVNT